MRKRKDIYVVNKVVASKKKGVAYYDVPIKLTCKADSIYLTGGKEYVIIGERNYADGHKCYILEGDILYEPFYFIEGGVYVQNSKGTK